jgi:phospholipid/cholesterol/gamma-HCH transport system substrate-binding protein
VTRSPGTRRAGLAAVLSVTALLLSGCGAFGDDTKTLSARFDRTVGVYVESDVRLLGVRIGQVTAIEPEGDAVRVDMEYDAKYKLPADAGAVVVAPSIVSDRYVQITPPYDGGEVLADGSTIDIDRTEVPLELDEIYSSLDELNRALGPEGANKNGALSDLLSVSAQNLEGNGEALGTTLEDFSQAISTLAERRDDLFGTIVNLQDFTTTVARSDDTVRAFNRDLAVVAEQLAAEREDLARAVRQLSIALGDVAVFVRENRESLTTNVEGLADVTGALIENRAALEEFIDTAPTALSNLQLAYNPASGTLDTRDYGPSKGERQPLLFLCPLLQESGGLLADSALAAVGDAVGAQLLELSQRCDEQAENVTIPGSAPAAAPSGFPMAGPAPVPAVPVPSDRSLAGLLMGTR